MLSEARLFMTPFSIPSTFKSLMSVFSVIELCAPLADGGESLPTQVITGIFLSRLPW